MILLWIIFLVVVLIWATSSRPIISGAGESVTIRSETFNESFNTLVRVAGNMNFYRQHGYDVTIPDVFNDIKTPLDDVTRARLRAAFEDIYKAIPTTEMQKIIDDGRDNIDRAIKMLRAKRGFKIHDRYEILLTMWGPGGSYDARSGRITVKARPDGTLSNHGLQTIIHEITHIAIQHIIEKKNIPHPVKEAIVDYICKEYLKLPNYRMQSFPSVDRTIIQSILAGPD